MSYQDTKTFKMRDYLFNIINVLTENSNYQINADMLGNIEDFSLDKIPTNKNIENWIIDDGLERIVYSFRSKKSYSTDAVVNLKNVGFFEDFEHKIEDNNRKGVLPEIDNIESIRCLNPWSMTRSQDGHTAEFNIQLEITYRRGEENNGTNSE